MRNNDEILLNLIKMLYVEREVKKELESLTTPYGLKKYINMFDWRNRLDKHMDSVNKKYTMRGNRFKKFKNTKVWVWFICFICNH